MLARTFSASSTITSMATPGGKRGARASSASSMPCRTSRALLPSRWKIPIDTAVSPARLVAMVS